MKQINSLHRKILEEVKNFHKSESRILDLLQKIDSEKLYLEMGYPSLFKYAVGYLKLSEAQSWAFMTVARKSKEIPKLKEQIDSGELSVSTIMKRYLPTNLRLQVLKRDQSKCQFKSPTGIFCGNESFIQIHHLEPWSQGGKHELNNLQTLCSAHHVFEHNKKLNSSPHTRRSNHGIH